MIETKIFAHRGSAGTHPENTMVSFRAAERAGADGIELDVQLSRDGELVVIHDEKLDRTTNGNGYVKDLTLKELKGLDASVHFKGKAGPEKIPALHEVLDMFTRNNMLLNIELKNGVFMYEGMEEKVIELVHAYDLQDRVILSSFNHYSLVRVFQLAPHIETAPLYRDGLYMPWVYAKAIGARAIHPNKLAAPDPIIVEAMKNGIQVRPYTVNSEKQMLRLFSLNCSAFITDYPAKAVSLKRSLQQR